ncbi:MAG: 6-phosphogluconolactonase [Deltaproteobacteria bacterium]|nr:6-phosphogluconolactonase [Deltaproteobacteria bacterium]MCL4874482.1 6-phosphogluconolactonase [bacterium]
MRKGLVIHRGEKELARGAAALFHDAGRAAIRERGLFTAVLSGGRTPRALYELLGAEYRDKADWGRVHLFWGDERCVPPDSDESNFKAANDGLISRIAIPSENIHRIKGELPPKEAALAYEDEIRSFFRLGPGKLPPFDLVLLGLGADGHTLSVFPGTNALGEKERLVTENYVSLLGSWRVTLTIGALRESRKAMFLASGWDKAAALRDVLRGKAPVAGPARMVEAREVVWLVDREAAALLGEQSD